MEEELNFLVLSDGRRISYREQGVPKQKAKRSLLVLHGLGSSRLAGMPGVSEDLLKGMELRLVSIDRPGYGLSDPNPKQTFETFAKDIANIADILELGNKIWLLGYSCGGAYCWGAARYIPDRIAGIGMWAPVGNYWWKDVTGDERKAIMSTITAKSRKDLSTVRKLPSWLVHLYVRYVVVGHAGDKWVENTMEGLSPPDKRNLSLNASSGLMLRDSLEAAKQRGFGMAQDLLLITSNWEFQPSDVARVYHGPLHIWNGDEDWLVPLRLQEWIKRQIPELVQLRGLPGEGHLSAFCFNDKIHHETLTTLFGVAKGAGEVGLDAINSRQQDSVALQVQNKGAPLPQAMKEDLEALAAPILH